MNKMIVTTIISAVALISATVGAYEYFTPRSEHELVSMRLEQKIQSDSVGNIQKRIWDFEAWHGCYGVENCMKKLAPEALKQYLELVEDLRKLTGN